MSENRLQHYLPLYHIFGPPYSQRKASFFCWKVAERNIRNPWFAKFDFTVPLSGGQKNVNGDRLPH